MATIRISNLNPAGVEFFGDTESYFNELTDEEINLTNGGFPWSAVAASAAFSYLVLEAYDLGRQHRSC